MKKRLSTFSARSVMTMMVLSVCCSSTASLTPAWDGQSGSIYHLYTYPDDSVNPEPDPKRNDNPYGSPASTISYDTEFGSGWQDPSVTDVPEAYGDPAHGAWCLEDITDVAYIEVAMPVNAEWVANGLVDLHVNVVGYTTLNALPSLTVDGTQIAEYEDSYAFDDYREGNFQGNDEWWYRTWTPQLSNIQDNNLTLTFNSASSGSTIDTVEIYAIPEPSAIWIMGLVGAGLFAARRFWSRIRSTGS